MLRQARLDRRISLDAAARDTRIRRAYLEALEAEDMARLPLPVYTRGFVRAYAEYLGLNPQVALDMYQPAEQAEQAPPIRPAAPRVPIPRQLPVRPILWLVGVVLTVLLVAFLWKEYQDARVSVQNADNSGPVRAITPTLPPRVPTALSLTNVSSVPSPSPVAAFASPSPIPSVVSSPTPVLNGILVEFQTTDSVYIEVSIDGQLAAAQTFPAGTDKVLPVAQSSVVMRVSDPQSVDVIVNGQPQTAAAGTDPVEYTWQR